MAQIQRLDMSRSLKTKVLVVGKKVPIECPVCKLLLRDSDDVKSVNEDTACTECALNFKNSYRKQWESGWRPSVSEARAKIFGTAGLENINT